MGLLAGQGHVDDLSPDSLREEAESAGAALAERLRRLRDAAGLTQRELAHRTHVSDSSLSRYLAGRSLPPWEVVAGLCELGGGDREQLHMLWDAAGKARRQSRGTNESVEGTDEISRGGLPPAGPAAAAGIALPPWRRDAMFLAAIGFAAVIGVAAYVLGRARPGAQERTPTLTFGSVRRRRLGRPEPRFGQRRGFGESVGGAI